MAGDFCLMRLPGYLAGGRSGLPGVLRSGHGPHEACYRAAYVFKGYSMYWGLVADRPDPTHLLFVPSTVCMAAVRRIGYEHSLTEAGGYSGHVMLELSTRTEHGLPASVWRLTVSMGQAREWLLSQVRRALPRGD